MTMPWGGHYYYAAGGFVWTGGDITGTAQRPGGEDGPPIARFPASLRARETIDRVAEKRYNNQPGGKVRGRYGAAKVRPSLVSPRLPPSIVRTLRPGGGNGPPNCAPPYSFA